jgi:3-oxoacyl-[acyl-carrier-protein] synthase III
MATTITAPQDRGQARAAYGAAITSVASALPERVVTNEPIAQRLGIDPDWIVARTGISERRYVAPGERLSDLAAEAGRRALEKAGVTADRVELVLVGTSQADELTPNAAPLVAHAIGAHNAGAADVGAACTSFLTGLALGSAWIEAGRAETVLVVGADALSRHTDPDDRGTAALFGDAAGAAVLSRVAAPGAIGPVYLGADGSGSSALFASIERAVVEMDGQMVFRHAVARMSESTEIACARAGVAQEDIDLFVYHQANARILRSLVAALGLPTERVVDCIARFGNTSAASLPLALSAAEEDGRLWPGARVLLSAFGAGFTWGGTVIEWQAR